jgi:hypothetical protein
VKKSFLNIILSILMLPDAGAQSKTGMENYNLLSKGESYMWMPVVHHVGKKGLHTELRYNYEDQNTGSVYIGKNFKRGDNHHFSITPMLGLVFGKYNGGSAALNTEWEHKKLFMSVQTQYTISRNGPDENFFFNWSELGIQPVKWFYTGLSAQMTRLYKQNTEAEYGILAGVNVNRFSIPVYVFSPLSSNRSFIIGINAEW